MDTDDPIEKGKAAIVGELVKEVAKSPKVREAGDQIAQTVLTISKTINVCLLPIAAVNFGYEKAREYFMNCFSKDFENKTKSIPKECVVEPKISIVGPALQGLAFSCEEDELKSMYISLIAAAIDVRKAQDVHPAFIEIVRQITAKEAILLQTVLSLDIMPIAQLILHDGEDGRFLVMTRHLMSVAVYTEGSNEQNIVEQSMVENWIRLGLVEVSYEDLLATRAYYDFVKGAPKYLELHKVHGDRLTVGQGVLSRTSFGEKFARSVGILPDLNFIA